MALITNGESGSSVRTKLNEALTLTQAITASPSELNILDGATLTVTELNYVAGVTSAIQTQLDSKLASATAASTYFTLANATTLQSEVDLNTAKVSNATHTGDVTGSTALTIANDAVTTAKIINGAVTIAKLSATGTANSSTFLRGDGTWATPAGGGGGDLLAANNLSDLADIPTARTNLGLAIGTDVQAYSSNLTSFATVTPSANGLSLVSAANYAAMKTLLSLTIGVDVQAYNANLTTYAGIAPSANVQTLLGAANYAAFKTSLSLNNVENTALSSWTGSSNITTLGTIGTGTWNATAIGLTKGGTGFTSYAAGDLIYASAINTLSKLAAGTNGHVLTLSGGVPTWAAPSGGGGATNFNDIGDATATGAIDNLAYAQTLDWSTLTTGTAWTIGAAAITTGTILKVNAGSTITSGSGRIASFQVNSVEQLGLFSTSVRLKDGNYLSLETANEDRYGFAKNGTQVRVYANGFAWYITNSIIGSVTGNGAFLTQTSTAAAPAFYTGVGGSSTGIYGVSSGVLGITAAGSKQIEISTTLVTFTNGISTAAPSGGTAATWKLGTVATVSPTSPNRTIELDVNGTIYYLHAKTTND